MTSLIRRQEKFAADLFWAFDSGNFEGIAEGYQKIPSDNRLLIFDVLMTSSLFMSKFAYMSSSGKSLEHSEESYHAVCCRSYIPAKGGQSIFLCSGLFTQQFSAPTTSTSTRDFFG
jgi:hypothetical protein